MPIGMCYSLELEEFFAELARVYVEGCGWRGAAGEGLGEEFVVGLRDTV